VYEKAKPEHALVKVRIAGELHKRVRAGRKVYRGFFVLMADGKMLLNLGKRNSRGGFDGEREITFERTLAIVAKSGPSGLEGSLPDGGRWFVLHLAPSSRERRVVLKLPIVGEEFLKLEVKGAFDIKELELCRNCDYRELIELRPT